MKPIKAYKTYQGSLDAERHREKQWRSTKQGAFEASFVSFEETTEKYYPLSAAVRRVAARDEEATRKAIDSARKTVERKASECKEVFGLILKNGSNRQKSIEEMIVKRIAKITLRGYADALYHAAEMKYLRHRTRLIEVLILDKQKIS